MKKLAAILCLSAMATGAFAQGVVIFNNSPATLVSSQNPGQTATAISGAAGSFFFGLLTSATGAPGSFTFANLYATNSGAAAGRFIGGTVGVTGWAAGTTMSYEVAGWTSALGTTFNPAWLTTHPGGFFGTSVVGSGVAGGTTAGGQSFPTLPLFGGTGIGTGFVLTGVPEPSSMALAGLGAAALLIFRRRK
jgi:hypothetical protein